MSTKNILESDWYNYLDTFLKSPAVIGSEQPLIDTIEEEMSKLNLKTKSYLGLLEVSGTDPESIFLSIHIDRHGLVCTGPGEFQYAAFIAKYHSDLDGNSISEQTYKSLLKRFCNQKVYAYSPCSGKAIAKGTINSSHMCPLRDSIIFKINGIDEIPAGVPISYEPNIVIEEGRVSAQLDNVLLVSVVAALFKQGFQGTALFTTQEEAGRSWRYIEEYFVRKDAPPRNLLVLDTSPFPSDQDADAQSVVLRNKDANASFDPRITKEIEDRCESLGITYRYKDLFIDNLNKEREKENSHPMSYGRTELGRLVHATNGRMNGSSIQIPTTGYHTTSETAKIQAIEDVMTLLRTIL